ncbi:MAG: DUF6325 family protein [Ilumatobacteraceae bacterium]|jgi:hypothetical protein|nr:DUF6325 family protein [Ilumatobacteraceae bacterium]
MDTNEIEGLGPIDYIVVEFPADAEADGSAFSILLDLQQRGIIRILDLAVIAKGADGTVTGINLSESNIQGEFDVTLFAEASSGLLDADDLAEAGAAVEAGRVAAVLVYENTWAAPFAIALRQKGAMLVANGRIPVQAILSTLDQLEAAG